MQIFPGVGIKPYRFSAQEPSRSPQVIVTVQPVVLKEHKDIVLINPDYGDIHCVQIDSPERQHKFGGVRKDIAVEQKLYGRLRFLIPEHRAVCLAQPFAPAVPDSGGHVDRYA